METRKEIFDHKSLDSFVFNYQNKVNENLIIEVPIRNIEVLKEPLDFYSALNVRFVVSLTEIERNNRLLLTDMPKQSVLGLELDGVESHKKTSPETPKK